jgi:hypothetical protein
MLKNRSNTSEKKLTIAKSPIESYGCFRPRAGIARRLAFPVRLFLAAVFGIAYFAAPILAEPLDQPTFATLGVSARLSRMHGRMGFDQLVALGGTVNDFRGDLRLPEDNKTFEINLSVRPLEHHVLRAFGRVPENYSGDSILDRTLRTRNNTYVPGQAITSNLQTAMATFAYDLDMLIGPRWYGGLHGDLRYIFLEVRMGTPQLRREDIITFAELAPCLGAHFDARLPIGFGGPISTVGGFARLSYAITPNFLNYVELSMGLSVFSVPTSSLRVQGKIGYEHESFIHQQTNTLEFRRDGILFSIETAF